MGGPLTIMFPGVLFTEDRTERFLGFKNRYRFIKMRIDSNREICIFSSAVGVILHNLTISWLFIFPKASLSHTHITAEPRPAGAFPVRRAHGSVGATETLSEHLTCLCVCVTVMLGQKRFLCAVISAVRVQCVCVNELTFSPSRSVCVGKVMEDRGHLTLMNCSPMPRSPSLAVC